MIESSSFDDALVASCEGSRKSRRLMRKRCEFRRKPMTSQTVGKRSESKMTCNDSDDDFEIVSYVDTIKWFYPIDKEWQMAKCKEFSMNLKKPLDFKVDDPVPATAPLEIHEIEGDGNCYFRCLSYLITGNDKSHRIVRQKLVKFMKANEELVKGLGGRNYLNESLMWTDGMWPTEVEIYVSACMLQTDIYTYVDGKWLRFSSDGKLELKDNVQRAIYLENKDNVHYDVVVQVKDPEILVPVRVYSTTRKKPETKILKVDNITLPSIPKEPIDIETPSGDIQTLELPIPSLAAPKRRLEWPKLI